MIAFIFKGRGILIPVFFIVPFIVSLMISGELDRNIGGIFSTEYSKQLLLGLGFVISGAWCFYTSNDYIKVDGKKVKIEMQNHFFFITNKNWSYIIGGLGILIILGGIIEFIKPS